MPAAKFGWSALKRLYSDEQDLEVKDALAVALAAIADAEVIDEIIALARDGRHGPSRLLLLSALERSSDSPRAGCADGTWDGRAARERGSGHPAETQSDEKALMSSVARSSREVCEESRCL